MIDQVTLERTTWAAPPARFEAGTPPIAEVVGLAAALDYVDGVGLSRIAAWEDELLAWEPSGCGRSRASAWWARRREGRACSRSSSRACIPHDVAAVLDDAGVAVRAGHHCAQPVMARFGVPATVRASFAFYNTAGEIEALGRGVERAAEVFR